jgi:glycosyltransferase involved in cell wall biosynthesis
VHDYLTQFGGAEQVLSVLQQLFPTAPTLTALVDAGVQFPGVEVSRVIESWLGMIPGLRRRHRLAMPVFPLAMRELGRRLGEVDVLIADTSAWAHQVSLSERQALVAYCHSPARFLYGDPHYLGATGVSGLTERALNRALAPYRRWDRRAYHRADVVLANSNAVAARLRDHVGVGATVVYPPVEVGRFQTSARQEPEDWYLVVSRLVPHKRIDLVVATAAKHGHRVKVIGAGRDESRLRGLAGATVEFLGFQTPDSVAEHLQRCRAFILPGMEDFGITAVEAQAAGRPVVAFDAGGARETVLDGRTGILFGDQTVLGLESALRRLESLQIDAVECVTNAMRFDRSRFEEAILKSVDEAWRLRRL